MGAIHGFCDERFAPLEEMFRANQDDEIDAGASLAVTLDGEFVVDLWAGTTDYELKEPWVEDTLVYVFSTSKVMVNIAVLMTYDRGLLDLDAPIVEYWPEFGQNGKDRITTRQILVHKSGLPGFGRPIGWDEIHDWDHMIGVLEAAELWYEPGTVAHYHPLTYGFLLGELVHRTAGVAFADFFAREVAAPMGADFHFGLTAPEDQARVAELWPADPETTNEAVDDPVMAELEEGLWVVPERMAAVMPSTNGIGNARSIARICSMMATGGELEGRRYLSKATIDEAGTEQSFEDDRMLGPCRYGLGFGLDSEYFPGPSPTAMHWGGYGGSLATMDPATGISAGFAPNRLLADPEPDGAPMMQDRLSRLISTIGEVSRPFGSASL
ncbi:MAG TPA: serine hydrolase domain-containing protein [Acidimicrobiales bacterium]|nr:serine hydrolase domain-containing protein [Acidimicrobiales bacterium]